MRSLSFKLAFLRLPNILQVFPAAGTASIFLGAGSLLVPHPAPRVSCVSGQPHHRARRDPEPPGAGRFAWPPWAAAKSEADFKLQSCVWHQRLQRGTATTLRSWDWKTLPRRWDLTQPSQPSWLITGAQQLPMLLDKLGLSSSSWKFPRCKAKGRSRQSGSRGRQVAKNTLFPF